MDIQAAKTVTITMLAFLLCYIPPIFFVIINLFRSAGADHVSKWPGFLAQLSIFISSGINPIIYCFRTRRFRWALKQLLRDPCGKSPFQETNKVKRAGQDFPRKVTRQAAASNKITNEPEAVSASPKPRATAAQGEQGCEEKETTRNKGQASVSRTSNHVTASSNPESEGVAKLAWEEDNHMDAEETSSGGKSPSRCGDYTRQEVTVEVHRDPKDIATNQVQRAVQDIPCKVTRKAAASNKITDEPEAASTTTECRASAAQGVQGCEEK